MAYGTMHGRYPAIVKTYDQAKRTCRIEIPGLTDGGDVLPEAEIEYPIGDKSRKGQFETELEILPGDTVWVAFICGDPRYPVITGYRNPQTGNSADWRRYHHANIELLADKLMHFDAGEAINQDAGQSIALKAGQTVTVNAGQTIGLSAGQSIRLSVGGSTIEITPSAVTITSGQINLNGPISGGGSGGATATFTGGVTASKDVVAGGISVMNHVHTEQGDGADVSKPK